MVLEPGTPWARDPQELARRNTHSVGEEVVARRLASWQEVLPRYYGWFLHLTDSREVLARAREGLASMLEGSDKLRGRAGGQ